MEELLCAGEQNSWTQEEREYVIKSESYWKLLLIGIIVGGCATVSFGVGAFKGILASAPDISEVDVIPTGYSTESAWRQTEVRQQN